MDDRPHEDIAETNRLARFYALGRVDPTTADDVAQEVSEQRLTMAAAGRALPSIGTHATRRAIDAFRRTIRSVPVDPSVEHPSTAAPSAEDEAMRQIDAQVAQVQVAALINWACEHLSARQYDALIALYDADGTVADAINVLVDESGVDPRTIRTHLDRAKAKARGFIPCDHDD